MTTSSSSFVEWFASMSAEQTDTIATVVCAALTALFALGYTLGGMWAVRGRPSLQRPVCGRCDALLRSGSGVVLPSVCSECGAALDGDRAVRWLRFRRQPTTFFITAPVLFVGGTFVAAATAFMIVEAGIARVDGMRLALDAERERRTVEPVPAPEELRALIASAREGGTRGDGALRRLADGLDDRASKQDAISDRDVEELIALVRDLIAGVTPAPLASSDLDDNASVLAIVNVDALCMQLLAVLVAHGRMPLDEAMRLLQPIAPRVVCIVPQRVQPDSALPIQLSVPFLSFEPFCNVRAVRIDGSAVSPTNGMGGDSFLATAPSDEGSVEIQVDWEVIVGLDAQGKIWPDRHHAVAWPARELFAFRGTSVERVDVVNGPEIIAPFAGELQPEQLAKVPMYVVVTEFPLIPGAPTPASGFQRDYVQLGVRPADGVMLDGTWSLKRDDEWIPLHDVTKGSGYSRALQSLIDRPSGGWPSRLQLRFEPRMTGAPLTLAPMVASSANPLRGTDWWKARAVRGVWQHPIDFTFVEHPPFGKSNRSYRVELRLK